MNGEDFTIETSCTSTFSSYLFWNDFWTYPSLAPDQVYLNELRFLQYGIFSYKFKEPFSHLIHHICQQTNAAQKT